MNVNQGATFEEKQLEEKLKSLQIDMGNIARIIADTINGDKDKVFQDMVNRTTLYPEEAVKYGLVHEIKSELFEAGAEVISIQPTVQASPPSKAESTPIKAEAGSTEVLPLYEKLA